MKLGMLVMLMLLVCSVANALPGALTDVRYQSGPQGLWGSYAEALVMYEGWGLDIVEVECEGYKELDLGVSRTIASRNGLTLTGELYTARATGDQRYWIPAVYLLADKPTWHGQLAVLQYVPANGQSFEQTWVYLEAFSRQKGYDLGISTEHIRLRCDPKVAADKYGVAAQFPVGKLTGEVRLARVSEPSGWEVRYRLIGFFQ